MADTADDLSAPLGQETSRRKRRLRLPFTGMQALAVALGLLLVAFAGFAIFGDTPLGGEPVAHVALRQKATEEKAAAPVMAPAHAARTEKEAAPGEHRTVTIIDGSSGKRQDVMIGGDTSAANKPAGDKAEGDAAAPATMMAGADPRLLEKTRYGMIPIAAENLKPFTAYAAPFDQAR